MVRKIALLSVLFLSACGFQLRGAYPLPFSSIYITLPETAELRVLLKRAIAAGSNARVVDTQKDAQATLQIINDAQTKNILSVSGSGQILAYQLVRTFSFRVTDKAGRDWLPQGQIVIHRDITYNSSLVLSKESEEALLWNDIQNDLVQQMLRRLAAGKSPSDVEKG